MSLQPFFDAPLAIQIHAVSAIEALVLGAYVLSARKKGGRLHKIIGYVWATNMAIAIATSWFISELRIIGPFSPIHLLSAYATFALLAAIRHARRGNIAAHRGTMGGLYFGGVLTAAVLAFLPGRVMNRMVFAHIGEETGFALVLGIALIGVSVYFSGMNRLRRRAARHPPVLTAKPKQ